MSATRLLVLAIVRAHGRTHGYVIGRDMEALGADKWANTKNGSIYHALRQLAKEGLLDPVDSVAGEIAPARTDYEITSLGEEAFQELMDEALTQPVPRPDMLCAGLCMMTALPRAKVLEYLRNRLDTLASHMASVTEADANTQWTGENAVPQHLETLIGFWANHTQANYNWIAGLIARLESGAYVFADENPKAFGNPDSLAAAL